MGKPGSSASKTFPERSEKVTRKGDLVTSTLTAPAVIFTSFCPSWIWTGLPMEFTGVSARAHEISFGKCPLGATRTRIMPFETWAIRTLASPAVSSAPSRSEEHTSELQSHSDLVCRLLLEKKKMNNNIPVSMICIQLDDLSCV